MSKASETAPLVRLRRAAIADARSVARMIEPAFARFVAPTLGLAGQVAFRMYVTERALRERLGGGSVAWCAVTDEDEPTLVGYAELRGPAARPAGTLHLTLLFTNVDWHGNGIARRLIGAVTDHLLAADPPVRRLTVNASAYAVPIYARLGFEIDGEDTAGEDGIIASPMRLQLGPPGSRHGAAGTIPAD